MAQKSCFDLLSAKLMKKWSWQKQQCINGGGGVAVAAARGRLRHALQGMKTDCAGKNKPRNKAYVLYISEQ